MEPIYKDYGNIWPYFAAYHIMLGKIIYNLSLNQV